MAEDEAAHAFRAGELDGERIGFVIGGSGHRQSDNDSGSFVEFARRQHDQRVYIPHVATRLRVAVNPNHVSPIGAP